MDKRKLVNIIVKDIEEIRILSEEVAESEDASALVIDLALYRARLLCQEIELLRDLVENAPSLEPQEEEVIFDSEEEDDSILDFPDPELEILNFDQDEYPEMEKLTDEDDFLEAEDEDTEEVEEEVEDDQEEEEVDLEEDLEEEMIEEEDLDQEDDQEVITEEDLDQEDDLEVITEEDLEEEDLKEEQEEDKQEDIEKEEEDQQQATIQTTELQEHPQTGFREIQIEDLDDEDEIKPVRFAPISNPTARPVMREIPKPDFLDNQAPENEKKVVGEKYQKERSLNDSIGEKKPIDSKLPFDRITSLRAAIGLNDRFLFIREIFDNNSEKYNKVIEHLDKLEQIQEAVEYLKANLTMQKNEASMKFVELLKRRFIP